MKKTPLPYEHSPGTQILKSPIQELDSEEEEQESEDENPLLFVDVNLGPGQQERIIVRDGDTAEGLAEDFAKVHNL